MTERFFQYRVAINLTMSNKPDFRRHLSVNVMFKLVKLG